MFIILSVLDSNLKGRNRAAGAWEGVADRKGMDRQL